MKCSLKAFRSNTEEIGISPLIDIVFILLIFFVVTTSFVSERGMELRTSEATSPIVEIEEPPIVMKLDRDGMIAIDGRVYSLVQLPGVLRSKLGILDSPTLVLEFPEDVNMASVSTVMDRCREVTSKSLVLRSV